MVFFQASNTFESGSYEIEWLPLSESLCYGFSGPNACYDEKCQHNPKLLKPSEIKSQLSATKVNLPKHNSRFFAVKTPPTAHHDANEDFYEEYDSYGTPLTPFSDESYDDCNKDYYFEHLHSEYADSVSACEDEAYWQASYQSTQQRDEYARRDIYSPVLTNQDVFESASKNYCQFEGKSPRKTVSKYDDRIDKEQHEDGDESVAVKKYEFNPLSEPFQPSIKSFDIGLDPTTNTVQPSAADIHAEWGKNIKFSRNGIVNRLHSPCEKFSKSNDLHSSVDGTVTSTATTALGPLIDSETESDSTDLRFACVLCAARFSTIHSLRRHILAKVLRPYVCIICSAAYGCKLKLQRHQNLHRNLKSFKCRGCHNKFKSFNQLSKHSDICQINFVP